MAGVRPDTKPKIDAGNPFTSADALFVTNPSGDRNIQILELQRTMRDGSGLESVEDKDSLTFATRADLNALLNPANGNYRIKNGKLQIVNASTQMWHEIWFEADENGNPVLRWTQNGVQ